MNKEQIKQLLMEILQEECGAGPIRKIVPASVCLTENDRLQTGNALDRVYTRDVLTLEESPRLGCGIMEMEQTTFPWTLQYDEIDYVLEGKLSIICGSQTVTAAAGEVIYIPKGCSIAFSAPDKARFLYVTYPADWQNQK